MSRFRIYQIDHFDPRIIGRKKRRLLTLYSVLTPVTIMIFNTIQQLNGSFLLLVIIVLPISTAVYLVLYRKLKNETYKTIGEIEFTRSLIRKKVGDSSTEYKFQTISGLELEKHIPSIKPEDSKSGYFSYILKIKFKNARAESLVVSDKPVDRKQNLSILETLRTLKKISNLDIRMIE